MPSATSPIPLKLIQFLYYIYYYTTSALKSQRFSLKIENLKVLYRFSGTDLNIYVQIAQELFVFLLNRDVKYLLAEMLNFHTVY